MKYRVLYILAAAAALTGCGKTLTPYSAKISYIVENVNTKADLPTKGTVVTTANIPTVYGSFVTDVWVNDADASEAEAHSQDPHQIDKQLVTYDADATPFKWNLPSDTYWLRDTYECFWSWAPEEVPTRVINDPLTHDEEGELTFSYVMPTPNGSTDASIQKDLLFAYNWQKLPDGSKEGLVSIRFYHALSWVRFMIVKDDGTFDTNLEISKITLNNIHSTGNCTFKPSKTLPADKFEWANVNIAENKVNYGEDFTIARDFIAYDNTKASTFYSSKDKAFMLIPQTLASDASVTITFLRKDEGSYKQVVRTAILPTDTWNAGYYYTYKINAKELDDPIGFTVEYVDWEDGGTGQI